MEKTQREYYLNEQLKAIQKELGEIEDGKDETSNLNKAILKAKMPKEVEKKCLQELKKLKNMSPMSAEATVVRNYLDWMIDLPWSNKSKIIKDLNFRSNQTIISFISTITISSLKKMIKVKAQIVRAIPLPPISLKKGPVPICPPNKKVKSFFNKIGSTVEIKNEKLSINFWSTSGMMASYYELLKVMSVWLVKKGIKRSDAQKYITSLFLALSEDALSLIHI